MSTQDEIKELRERLGALQAELDSIRSEVLRLEKGAVPAAAPAAPHAEETQTPAPPSAPVRKKSVLLTELNLGGNILGKLGLLTIIIAAVWFIKFAFDNRWINESGRIFLGLAAGYAGIGWGLYLARRRMRIVPSALTGTAVSLLYIAVFSAYYFYDLLGRGETFVFLAMLSVALAFLAARAGIQTLYIFSVLGAFLAPLIVSSGENSYRFLFSYIALLNILFLVLSRYRVWNISAFILLIADAVLFSAWAADKLDVSSFTFPFIFLLIIFLIFMARQIVLLPLKEHAFAQSDALLIMLSTGTFLLLGTWVVDVFHPSLRPHFMLGVSTLVAAAYFAFNRFGGSYER